MWTKAELKRRGKGALKKNYWKVIAVCFIMALFFGEYEGSLTLTQYAETSLAQESEGITTQVKPEQKPNSQVLDELLHKGESFTAETPLQFGTHGVLAFVFNNITAAGSLLYGLLNTVNQIAFGNQIVAAGIVLMGAFISFLYYFFLTNTLKVSSARFFLETSAYPKTAADRLLFVFRHRRTRHVAWIMLVKSLYTALWSLTIIGGVIVSYSYRMIPYIVAENPNIGRKEAFVLSKRMMRGQKWKTFVLDMSFLGWEILGIATLGILKIFFVNGYVSAVDAELYKVLRDQAITEEYPNSEYLNDVYLTMPLILPDGTSAESYPTELFTIPEKAKRQWVHVDYRKNYSIRTLILLFVTFSVVGWLWEVSPHLATDGFVNRGVLHGPWLPIYGTGGVLILVVLKPFREKPWLTFLLTILVCGIVEYSTGWYLETFKHAKWWDYSGYFLNLQGRVCAEGLLVFGAGGCCIIYVLAPALDELFQRIPIKVRVALCVALVSIFTVDAVYSREHPNMGKGITEYSTEMHTKGAEPENRNLLLRQTGV